jgi:phage-related protein
MTASKKIRVVFYRGAGGNEPVRDWLKEQAKEDRIRIGEDIRVVELGWPIGMPVCRSLGDGLYEVRCNLKDRIARVIFAIDGDDMLLLHGFIKKTRATSKGDLDIARKRWKLFKGRRR